MQTKPNTEKNTTPEVICTAPWRITEVKPLENYKLEVKFVDGTKGLVEMHDLITSKQSGVFAKLKDTNVFNKVHINHGTPTWPNNIDLAPDNIHNEIKKIGVCKL